MKVERTEISIKLMPESPFELEALKEIRRRPISQSGKIFQNDWDQAGYLEIIFDDPYENH